MDTKRQNKPRTGKVYLVGTGPGDIGLVTLRAKECIELADVIIYDYLPNPQVLDWAQPQAEIIHISENSADEVMPQDELNRLLVEKGRAGLQVLRLKGGDPFVFGRGAEEAAAVLQAGLQLEVVPGLISTLTAPAYAGIPVTDPSQNSHITFLAREADVAIGESWVEFAALAKLGGTQVVSLGMETIAELARDMIAQGVRPDLPVALVHRAMTGRQETLIGMIQNIAEQAAERKFAGAAVGIFGDVVGLREQLRWHESRPLFGKTIVVTRTRKQGGALTKRLRDLGAEVLELATIRIEPPVDLRAFAELVQDSHSYDWIVFTSANGVSAFFEMFFKLYDDAREIGPARIAAIGPATAQRVKDHHFKVDLQPEQSVAESVVREFQKQGGVENLRILLVQAEKARDVLPKQLSQIGAIVDQAIAYRTVPETGDINGARRRFAEGGADLITFTSSSTVENFLALGLPWPEGMRVASIGPITSKTARDHGLRVDVEARQHDVDGLVEAVSQFFAKQKGGERA